RELKARPMAAGVPVKALSEALHRVSPPLPETQNADTRPLLTEIIARAGLETADGMVRPPGHSADLGAAEAGIAELERRLADLARTQGTADGRRSPRQGTERGSAPGEPAPARDPERRHPPPADRDHRPRRTGDGRWHGETARSLRRSRRGRGRDRRARKTPG